MTQPHQIDREAVALWGCADGNGVDPRLVFRDRADAFEAAAELGLTVQALYAAPEAVAWREKVARIIDPAAFMFSPGELDDKVYSASRAHAFDRADRILALISTNPVQGGEG